MRAHAARPSIPWLVLAALSVALLPAGQALHGNAVPPLVACGRVINEAGWPLADVSVTAVGHGVQSADHLPSPQTATGADGSFRVPILADRYLFAFADPLPPDRRAGAAYMGAEVVVQGNVGIVAGACGAPLGKPLAPVTLVAPGNGFVEVRATDAAVPEPLAAARVQVQVASAGLGASMSDAAGLARVACPLLLPVSVGITKVDYDAAQSAEFACAKLNLARALDVWRSPVNVTGVVSDADTGDAVADAHVAATPRVLQPGAANPYRLEQDAALDGSYALRLPWGDTFDVRATARGYADATESVDVGPADLVAGLEQDLDLARLRFAVSGLVEDFDGRGIEGASLTFTGPDDVGDAVGAATDAAGRFDLELRWGTYDVDVAAAAKNPRTCTLELTRDGGASFGPEACLRLLRAGGGVVQGLALDDLLGDVGVPGVAVRLDAAATTTDAAGAYHFEVSSGEATLSFHHDAYRELGRTIFVPFDRVDVLDNASLERRDLSITLAAVDSDGGAPIPGARLTVELRDADGVIRVSENLTADASGAAAVEVPWSALAGDLDVGDYTVDVSRLGGSPLYDPARCLGPFDLDFASPPGPLVCAVAAVDAVETPVGPVVDAHTGLPVAGVRVEATGPDPCETPAYACVVSTAADGTALLRLPEGRTFDVSASHDDYQPPAAVADAVPGDALFVDARLARVSERLTFTAVDAHTGAPVEGAELDLAGDGFMCDPGVGAFDCSGTTDAAGEVTLTLPWGDLGADVAAGEADVHLDAEVEAGVRFQAAARDVSVVRGAPADPAPLRLLRDPADAIGGAALDFLGRVVDGASVQATAERQDFACDPAVHDAGPGAGFPDCAGVAAPGAYAMVLPHGTLEAHAWTLDAQAPGHFLETTHGAAAGDEVDVTFWPLTFDLVVEPRSAIDNALVPFSIVCIRNLNDAQAGLPRLPVERCATNGPVAQAITFADLAWTRSGAADDSDPFVVRATAPDHFPASTAAALGPANAEVRLSLLPLVPEFDAGDPDGDLFPTGAENLLGTDPASATSHPLDDGLLRHDLNDGHSVFVRAVGGLGVGPGEPVVVAPAHGAFTFEFRAERYPTHLLGGAQPVPAPAGTPVAFALFDPSAATRLAAGLAGGRVPIDDLGEVALLLLKGRVGDGTFEGRPGDAVRVKVQADALPFAANVVVPWAFVEAGGPAPTLLGATQAASAYHSTLRNLFEGSAVADKLDYVFTPVLLAAATAGCAPGFAGDTVTVSCGADSVQGAVGAEAAATANVGQRRASVDVTTTDTVPGGPVGDHRVRLVADAQNPQATADGLEDTDGDGTSTPDELGDGRDPTDPTDDGGFPLSAVDAAREFLDALAADLQEWAGA